MTQYDAGPGDWSDREWEAPDKKQRPHATKPRFVLPPWALLASLIGIVILVGVGLVVIVRAMRDGGDQETGAVPPTAVLEELAPTATVELIMPTDLDTGEATATVVIPTPETEAAGLAAIAQDAVVKVTGTGKAGLNLRNKATKSAGILGTMPEGTELTVVGGPKQADGLVWWKLRTADGKEGWGAADFLALKLN
jgi:hypothetical protein